VGNSVIYDRLYVGDVTTFQTALVRYDFLHLSNTINNGLSHRHSVPDSLSPTDNWENRCILAPSAFASN